ELLRDAVCAGGEVEGAPSIIRRVLQRIQCGLYSRCVVGDAVALCSEILHIFPTCHWACERLIERAHWYPRSDNCETWEKSPLEAVFAATWLFSRLAARRRKGGIREEFEHIGCTRLVNARPNLDPASRASKKYIRFDPSTEPALTLLLY